MANVTSGWRIPQLAFERAPKRQQLIEVTSNSEQTPTPSPL